MIRTKKLISYLIATVLLCQIIYIGNFPVNANSGSKKTYLVTAKNSTAYNKAINEINTNAVEETFELTEEKIIVAELSENEASYL